MNFQSRWFSSSEYLFSVLFNCSSCWANQLHRAVGAFTSAELCFPVLLLYLERYHSHLCISVEHFSGFFSSLALGPIFLLSPLFLLFFSASFRFIAQYGVKGPRSRSDSTALVGLLVGGFLCCSLSCSDGFGFSCFLLFLRLVNRDMLLYVDDFSGSLLCIGLSFLLNRVLSLFI